MAASLQGLTTMDIEKVRSLALSGDGKAIEVRVIRRWTPYLRPNDRCYMLLDKNGDAIQAIAHGRRDIRAVESKIQMHSCYRIADYICSEIDPFINIVHHSINLRIGAATTITQLNNTADFPRHYFRPMIYDELPDISDSVQEVTDFFGTLERKDFRTTRTQEPMLHLTLSDPRGRRIVAAIWKEIIESPERMDRQRLDAAVNSTLIVMTAVKVTYHVGTLQLGSTAATYVYVNPVSPVVDSILESLNKRIAERLEQDGMAVAVGSTSNEKITIAELQQMTRNMLNARIFKVDATITDITSGKPWYYKACPHCPNTAYPSGKDWACTSDGKFPAPRHTYCFSVTITDATGNMATTLFDDAAKALTGKDCSELVVIEGYTDPNIVPDTLMAAKGKPKTFHLELQRDAGPNKLQLNVNQVTDTATPPTPSIMPVTPLQIKAETHNNTNTVAKRLNFTEQAAEEVAPKKPRNKK